MSDTQPTNLNDKLSHLEAQLIASIENNQGEEKAVIENRAPLNSQEMSTVYTSGKNRFLNTGSVHLRTDLALAPRGQKPRCPDQN
eukprot:Awhi_evm1s1520